MQRNNNLDGAFTEFPSLRRAFNRYQAMPAAARIAAARAESQVTPRRLWTDLGLPAAQSETLRDHAIAMLDLARRYPAEAYDSREVKRQIAVWAAPRVLADEWPLERMDAGRRGALRGRAADIVFADDWAKAGRAHVLNTPCDPADANDDEGCFVGDLDCIATALEAERCKQAYPAKADGLETIIKNCHSALMTDTGKNIWDQARAANTARDVIRRASAAARHNMPESSLALV